MMMPETAVGKDNALIVRHDKIRAARQRASCTVKRIRARQQPSQPFSIAVSRVPIARMFLLRWLYRERPPSLILLTRATACSIRGASSFATAAKTGTTTELPNWR
jgi:hypothetical protein